MRPGIDDRDGVRRGGVARAWRWGSIDRTGCQSDRPTANSSPALRRRARSLWCAGGQPAWPATQSNSVRTGTPVAPLGT